MQTTLVAPNALVASLNSISTSNLDEIQSFALAYQKRKLLSKLTTGSITPRAEAAATEKFLRMCKHVRGFSITPQNFIDEYLLGHFRKCSLAFFDGIDPEEFSLPNLHRLGGVGPGASILSHGSDFLRKMYYGPVSCTSVDVMHSYLRGCRSNPTDLAAAKRGIEIYGWNLSDSSRISFVEKNVDEARTIATEPSINMFYQLAIGEVINKRLSRMFCYSKEHTPKRNRALCRIGSIDGSFATIDLQSASDSIGLDLCKWVIPSYIMDLLLLFRCDRSQLPSGEILKLPMVSTMGNGWTFSLMTALISCACRAVCELFGSPEDSLNTSVFGDDIVIPTHLYGMTVRLLELLGFIVNSEKSYSDGPFRESCGHDFYHGRFCRPVFVRRLDTVSSLYVAFNRLAEWGAFHSIDVTSTLRLIRKSISEELLVPLDSDYSSGLRVPQLLARRHLWKGGLWSFKRLEPSAMTYDVTDEPTRSRSMSPQVNPDGCMVAFLGGYLRNGKISERSAHKVRWRLARRTTVNWDYRHALPCPGWDSEAERRFAATLVSII